MADYPIRCGKCSCEYFPRYVYAEKKALISKNENECTVDTSCPQCGAGKNNVKNVSEELTGKKRLLLS